MKRRAGSICSIASLKCAASVNGTRRDSSYTDRQDESFFEEESMVESLLTGEGAAVAEGAEGQGKLAMSPDDFSALEERVLRAIDLVRKERQARGAAEERATQAEGRIAQAEERAAKGESQISEKGQHVERLERELQELRAERDQVRQRVEKLLKQLDSLEL
jgi:septal ring factor EnvC (AmiA/AmiB activator)